ncbi:O-antigen ligase family protein [Vibrio rumoiensis]|uniref:O-antigen ligase family protein n=1 Tax=Vibrio rumoiensis TaxID=76258 RepID=UPI00374A43AB
MNRLFWVIISILFSVKILFISVDTVVITVLLPLLINLAILFVFSLSEIRRFILTRKIFSIVFIVNFSCLLSLLIGYINGFSLNSSVATYVKIITMQMLFIFGVFSAYLNYERRFIFLLAFLITIHMLFGVFAPFIGVGMQEFENVMRSAGIVGKVNNLANLALFASVLFFILSNRATNKLYLYISLLAFLVVFFTGTMKNILIIIVVMLYFLYSKSKNKIFGLLSLLLLVMFVCFIAIYDSEFNSRIEQFSSGININISEGDVVNNSMDWRLIHWKLLWNDWSSNYPLLGVGLGNHLYLKGLIYENNLTYDPHNDYLKILFEFGIIGFLPFVFLLVKLIICLRQISKCSLLSEALYYCAISMSVAMLVANILFGMAVFYFFWPLLGFCVFKIYNKQ